MKYKQVMRFFLFLAVSIIFFTNCSSSSDAVVPGTAIYNDTGMKLLGKSANPPFSVNPENPAASSTVTVTVSITGATGITFSASGTGCGTISSSAGSSPLTVTGTVGTYGYCDMEAVATGVTQTYEGRFEVEATDPHIPPVMLGSSFWEEEDLHAESVGAPVITGINGPTTLSVGGTTSHTILYTGSEDLMGVILQISGYENGYFISSTSEGTGVAGFDLEVSNTALAGTLTVNLIVIDDLERVSASYPVSLTIESASTGISQPELAAATTYSVSGKVTYEKFIVSESGRATTGTMVPVSSATIKAISKKDNTTVLATGTTGLDGTYKLSFTNSTDNPGYFVRVYTTSDALKQTVMNKNAATFAYSSTSEINMITEPNKSGFNLEIKEADNAGAFNIWDVTVSGNKYAKSSTGIAAPQLSILWTKGEMPGGQNGSYYTTDENTNLPLIAINGHISDTDEYDDMVIGHEYGHFVMAKYSTDDSPGGNHTLDTRSIPTLGLSEAWATFFAGATMGRSVYLDSNAEGIAVSYSFETPPSTVPRGTEGNLLAGNINEVTANAVLWDLLDSTNETKDTLQKHSEAIWKVMTGYLKSGSNTKYADRGYAGRDLVDFLDGWICLGFGNIGDNNESGLKGVAIGLMELPADFIKSDLASCR